MATSLRFVHLDTLNSLLPAFNVMRQLRPHLTDARSFAAQVAQQHAEGYRLLAASDAGSVVGLAGYRTQTNLLYGRFVYVDDLIVDGTLQRGGIGTQLLDAVRQIARKAGCTQFVLDTGLHMPLAQWAASSRHALRRTARPSFPSCGVHVMKILLINASPHGDASHGYRFADEIVGMLREHAAPAASAIKLIERDLAAAPLPPVARDYARAIMSRTPDKAQFEVSEQLIGEIETTDALIIHTPMHNFTVPAALKLWIDYALRIHRTLASKPEGKIGLMRDRPTIVIVGSGGLHSGERARQPDFLTPYLRYALGSIGIHSVQFLLLQGLVMGEATVAEALDAARVQLTRDAVFASLAAQAAGSASMAASTALSA